MARIRGRRRCANRLRRSDGRQRLRDGSLPAVPAAPPAQPAAETVKPGAPVECGGHEAATANRALVGKLLVRLRFADGVPDGTRDLGACVSVVGADGREHRRSRRHFGNLNRRAQRGGDDARAVELLATDLEVGLRSRCAASVARKSSASGPSRMLARFRATEHLLCQVAVRLGGGSGRIEFDHRIGNGDLREVPNVVSGLTAGARGYDQTEDDEGLAVHALAGGAPARGYYLSAPGPPAFVPAAVPEATWLYEPFQAPLEDQINRQEVDQKCMVNTAQHVTNPPQNPFVKALYNHFDGELFKERSPWYWADNIEVPTMLVEAWQDEQVGSRATELIERFQPGLTWRGLFTNGDHGEYYGADVLPAIDEFLRFYLAEEVPARFQGGTVTTYQPKHPDPAKDKGKGTTTTRPETFDEALARFAGRGTDSTDGGAGLTVANKATCIHANYLEKKEKVKLDLLMEVAQRAEAQQRLAPVTVDSEVL